MTSTQEYIREEERAREKRRTKLALEMEGATSEATTTEDPDLQQEIGGGCDMKEAGTREREED